jgi:hypothetical protein
MRRPPEKSAGEGWRAGNAKARALPGREPLDGDREGSRRSRAETSARDFSIRKASRHARPISATFEAPARPG